MPDNTLPRDVYIHLLEDKIWRLERELDELIRMHYRLDERGNDVD